MEYESVFKSQRKRLLEKYKEAGQEIIAHTIPYESTGVLQFDVVNPSEEGTDVAFAVARRNQQIRFFGYGVGQEVFLGPSAQRATDAETNLSKASSTNGAQDFIIEGVGFECRGMRLQYTGDDGNAVMDAINEGATLATPTGVDPDVAAAVNGLGEIYDPASIFSPPQMQSPFNLENGMFQALLGHLSLEFDWDPKRTEKIGTVAKLPQAGAASYLRANGSPEACNKYRVPEGYLWRKDGQPDSDFTALVTLENAMVVPISQISTWEATPVVVVPSKIFLVVKMSLFGLAVDMPSAN